MHGVLLYQFGHFTPSTELKFFSDAVLILSIVEWRKVCNKFNKYKWQIIKNQIFEIKIGFFLKLEL